MSVRSGVHHLGLGTYDYDACVDFYTRVLEWEITWQDLWLDSDGKEILKHVFFDTGDGTMISFMCSTPANPEYPAKWDTDLDSAAGVRAGTYHFAFAVGSVEELEERQRKVRKHGVETTEVLDHGWCKSVYFRAPDGLMLEFCVATRAFTDDDKQLKPRFQPGQPAYEGNPDLARHDLTVLGKADAPYFEAMVAAWSAPKDPAQSASAFSAPLD